MADKKCLMCEVVLVNFTASTKFCKCCSVKRRKELMKSYSKNRKPENQLKNTQKRNEKRQENRKLWKLSGLCGDCRSF